MHIETTFFFYSSRQVLIFLELRANEQDPRANKECVRPRRMGQRNEETFFFASEKEIYLLCDVSVGRPENNKDKFRKN